MASMIGEKLLCSGQLEKAAPVSEKKSFSMSVIVPTYRRPDDLLRCLLAMEKLIRRPDQLLVVCRTDDLLSRAIVARFLENSTKLPLQLVDVHEPGVVAALNAGLRASTEEIVCTTDDDAAPHPDWLQKIEECYQKDPSIVGVGGRDLVHAHGKVVNDPQIHVGTISSFGRMIGNHHLGVGEARVVDVLKGVNMSFKGDLLRAVKFDTRLKGSGAQVHNEVAISLAIRGKGQKIIYDPAILVDHYPAERFDEDMRGEQSDLALSNATFNFFLPLLERNSAWNRALIWYWYKFVGTSTAPGLVPTCRALIAGDCGAIHRWRVVRRAAYSAKKVFKRI